MSFPDGVEAHVRYAYQILTEIERQPQLSQRSLSQSVGIALGLTNFLVRRLVRKGWVRVIRIRANRVRYLLTPDGLAAKTRMSAVLLQNSVRFYMTARERIRASLASAGPPDAADGGGNRVVFYGTGEVAEIAYVCLQETNLSLVGVVGPPNGRGFFGLPVQSTDDVRDGSVNGTAYDRLVVTSFDDREAIRARLDTLGVAAERVHWL